MRVCLAIVFAAFVGVAPARADTGAGPTLLSVAAQQRHPSATWTLPAGVGAEAVEVATSPDVTSDGSFLPENTIAYEVLAPTATTWFSPRPLALGTFFVHVQSSDDVWSNVMVLTIANTAPRLRGSLRFLGRHATVVQATITVCDDIDGEPALLISERKWAGSQTFARATSQRRLFFLGNCRRFTVRWRLASRFYGVGHYTVRLQIRDDDGALSNVVARSWFTGD